MKSPRICSIAGCERLHSARGWCHYHYLRWRNHGDPLIARPMEMHNMKDSLEYSSWTAMKKRCLNKNHIYYNRYGGRGIKISERWVHSFLAFYGDLGPRPSSKHQLERIDNDGDYTPENCKWATKKEQANNRESSHFITINGETKTLTQWCEQLGLKYSTINKRITSYHWPIERALGISNV